MKILFMHPNMPGQFKHLCPALAAEPENQVVFVTRAKNAVIPGVHAVVYEVPRLESPHAHRYLAGAERAILQGQEVWRVCKALRDREGFTPDVVVAHPGWGDALFVKDVYPNTMLLNFFEFYYHSHGSDVNFDPAEPSTLDDDARVRVKNVINLLNLEAADWGLSPTHWQHQQHPAEFQHKISVIHDGIDTNFLVPKPEATVTLESGHKFKRGDEVITYVARNFEPYRGIHTFMRAVKILQKERPNLHVIAVGADEVSYGRRLPKGQTYRHNLLKELSLDPARLHFVGTQPYEAMLRIMAVGAAHIYLTYPFVLSWSMLEAMSSGCLLIGSNTPPVAEVIEDGVNGLLTDFFSPQQLAQKVIYALDHQKELEPLRRAARQTVVERYDIRKLLPLHVQLVKEVGRRQLPPPVNETINQLYRNAPVCQFPKRAANQ